MNFLPEDSTHMAHALELARRGLYTTTPNPRVGCVLTRDGVVIGEGWHERAGEPHAEVHALRAASERGMDARGTTAYVTLEPCVMCMGAISHARIRRIVFGAPDPKRGAAGSALQLADADFLNHRIEVEGGLHADACSGLLLDFFKARR